MSAKLTDSIKLERIQLPSNEIKILNWILSSKDVSNDFKYQAIEKFTGLCAKCGNQALYTLNDTKYCDSCLPMKSTTSLK